MWSQEQGSLIKNNLHTPTHTLRAHCLIWRETWGQCGDAEEYNEEEEEKKKQQPTWAAGETERQKEEGEDRAAGTRREERGGTGWNIQERSAVSVGRHRSDTDRNRQASQNQQRHSESHWHTAVLLTVHTSEQRELFIHERAKHAFRPHTGTTTCTREH